MKRTAAVPVDGWVALGAVVALCGSVVFAFFQVLESLR